MVTINFSASEKIDIFITHCGQNSLLEAFHAGVRVLAVPLFGDQHRNAQLAKENGLIEVLPKVDIETSSKIVNAVRNSLLPNERFNQRKDLEKKMYCYRIQNNLIHVSSLLRNSKKNAENLLVSTIETIYSTDSPPNFSKFPQNYHPNTLIRVIDCAVAFLLILVVFLIAKRFKKIIS